MTDPIADMLTRIRNGYLARKNVVEIPYSRFKEELGKLLVKLSYLEDMKVNNEKEVIKTLSVTLKYKNGVPAVTALDRISRPGLRVYRGHDKLPNVLSGMGRAIISTSQGLMTENEAKKKHLGGEVVLRVY